MEPPNWALIHLQYGLDLCIVIWAFKQFMLFST